MDKPLKYDEGKPMLHLVPTLWTRMLARVLEYGLEKYYRDSWKNFTIEKANEDLIPAAMRHIDAYRDGEYIDQETGCPHLAQAMWNCGVIMWHVENAKSEVV